MTFLMIGEEEEFCTPLLLLVAPEAVAVTLFMVGEEEELNTPEPPVPPVAMAVTSLIVGEEELELQTPYL